MCSDAACFTKPAIAAVRIRKAGELHALIECNVCKDCLERIQNANASRPRDWPKLVLTVVKL